MRQWAINTDSGDVSHVLVKAIPQLGEAQFQQTLLDSLYPVLPAASCAVYRTGVQSAPEFFMSASHGVPDTTLDCWRAYISGPYLSDRTLCREPSLPPFQSVSSGSPVQQLSHITAQEVPPEHRAKVYEAHGMAERVSIVEQQADGALFAINFYRHQHQRAFSDAQILAFEQLAPALLVLAHKHLALRRPPLTHVEQALTYPLALTREHERKYERDHAFAAQLLQVQRLSSALTPRECEVCAGILLGLTFDGIACQLGLTVSTVKTYRNRAFARLGIHFRNELFALALALKAQDRSF